MLKKTVLTLALGAALLGFSAAPAAADSVRFSYNDHNRGGYNRDHRGGWKRDHHRHYRPAPVYRYRPAPVYYAPYPVYRARPVYRQAYYPQPFFGLNLSFR